MSSDSPKPAPLTSWRGCALYAQQIIAHAGMQTPHAQYFNNAVEALKAAEAGPIATAGATVLMSFGRNDKGALGQGIQSSSQWEPLRAVTLPADTKIIAMAAAASNTAVVTSDGQLLLAGSNKTYMHANREPAGRKVPEPIAALAGQNVTRVFLASHSEHVFACANGRLYGWGSNSRALGLNKSSVSLAPTPMELVGDLNFPGGMPSDQLKVLALGLSHTVMITQDGSVYASGLNSRGQLGMGAPRNPYESVTFRKMECPPGTPQADAAACGTLHSAFVCADGSLFVCGQNQYGQLGLPSADDHFQPVRTNSGSLAGQRVTQLACGSESTFCITDDGQLHAAGNDSSGDLGLGTGDRIDTFMHVPLPEAAAQVAAGEHHTLVRTVSGAVYGWGNNTFGQVTPGNKSKAIMTPVKLTALDGKRVVDISAGKAHSLVVTVAD